MGDVSTIDEKVICSSCSQELEIGDYPFCPHESIYVQNAQGFTPVVVHKDPVTGKIRFPGASDAPVPKGYQRVELTTVSEIRRLEREVNQFENSKSEFTRAAQRHVSQAEHKERREKFKEMVRNFSPRGKRFAETIMEARDKRQGRLDRPVGDPNFHVEAFSQNSSNREVYNDQRTGWRGRKH